MYVSYEKSIQPFQKVFLGRAEIVGYKRSDTPKEVYTEGNRDQVRQKRNGSLMEQSESNRNFSVGPALNRELAIFWLSTRKDDNATIPHILGPISLICPFCVKMDYKASLKEET